MMSGERHLHKYLLVCISQGSLHGSAGSHFSASSHELLAAVQFAGLKKNIMRLSAFGVWICHNQQKPRFPAFEKQKCACHAVSTQYKATVVKDRVQAELMCGGCVHR
jgi:hypothetical protein